MANFWHQLHGNLAKSNRQNTMPVHCLSFVVIRPVVTTAGAQWLQAQGQSRVSSQDAAVIYALDPVYAAGFSYLLLDERLGTQGLVGAGVVLAAVVLSRLQNGMKGDTGSVPKYDATAVRLLQQESTNELKRCRLRKRQVFLDLLSGESRFAKYIQSLTPFMC